MKNSYNKQLNSFAKEYRRYINVYTEKLNRDINKLKKIENNDDNEEEIKNIKHDIKVDQDGISFSIRVLNSIRIPFLEDIEERKNFATFVEEIKEVIPNDVPLVFHGCGFIDTVEDIIQSGGLYPPADRGYDVSATSHYIFICTKSDIKTALEYANREYCIPYGALFVLAPKDELEKEKFLHADAFIAKGNKTFVTTTSLNFYEEPNRLVAIITTSENLDRLKELARENGLNDDLIVTHNEFIQICKQKYGNNKHASI